MLLAVLFRFFLFIKKIPWMHSSRSINGSPLIHSPRTPQSSRHKNTNAEEEKTRWSPANSDQTKCFLAARSAAWNVVEKSFHASIIASKVIRLMTSRNRYETNFVSASNGFFCVSVSPLPQQREALIAPVDAPTLAASVCRRQAVEKAVMCAESSHRPHQMDVASDKKPTGGKIITLISPAIRDMRMSHGFTSRRALATLVAALPRLHASARTPRTCASRTIYHS